MTCSEVEIQNMGAGLSVGHVCDLQNNEYDPPLPLATLFVSMQTVNILDPVTAHEENKTEYF